MKHRFVLALASAVVLSSAALGVACKSNTITQNNTDDFESFSSATMTTDQPFDLDGPDHAHVSAAAHAVDTDTTITIGRVRPTEPKLPPLPPGWAASGGYYAFEPHSQTFATTVKIRVPYTVPSNGGGVRLATAEPGGSWSPVDGATFGADSTAPGTFSFTDAPHFSYYCVVTGAPADPTLHDAGYDATVEAGPDAAPDAAPDAPAEAGPPPSPTLFVATLTGRVFRFGLTPSAVIAAPDAGASDASADAAADADAEAGPPPGPSADAGATSDGGLYALPFNATGMAMSSAPYSLYAGFAQFRIGDPFPGGAPDSGAVAIFSDPFGAPALSGGFAVPNVGLMTYFNNELWASIGAPPNIATYANVTKSWDGTAAGMTANGYYGIAADNASHTIFLAVQGPDAVQRWLTSGTGGAKQVIKQTDISTNLVFPSALSVTPWGELLVLNADNTIARFDAATGAYKASYAGGNFNVALGGAIATVRWPNGTDEIFVGDRNTNNLARFVFTDATHTAVLAAGAVPLNDGIVAMLVAP